MNKCQACGADFAPGTAFCPACGAPTTPAPGAAAPPPAGYQQPPAGYQQPPAGYQQPPAGYQQPPAGYQQPAAPVAGQNDTAMSVLAYLGILVLVPLLSGAYKQSRAVKFHTNQGIILAILGVAYGVVAGIVMAIATAVFTASLSGFTYSRGAGYSLVMGLIWLLSLGILVLVIIGIVNAVQGKEKPLPLIGKFQILK